MFKGTLLAQIIAGVSSIFIAKLYGAEAYGVLSVFISFSTILSVFNSLQLDNCIIISNKKVVIKNWFNFLFLIIPIMTFCGIVILWPLHKTFFDNNLSFSVFILTFFYSIFISYNKTHEYLLTKFKKFSPISFSKVLLVLINVFCQFIFYYKFKIYGLIYSSIISVIIVAIYFSFKNKKYFKPVNFNLIKKDINKHKSIITYLLPSRFINGLATQSIPILIFAFFSLKDAGIFFFSQKILSMPLFIISSSISTVYFEKAASLFNSSKEKLFYSTRKIIITNLLIMFTFLVLLNTIGVYLLGMFLNKNWENLSLYIFVLSFLFFTKSSFSPISNIIVVLNKNHISLLFNIYILLVNCIAFYLGFLKNDLIYAIYLLSFLGGLGYFCLTIYFLRTIKKSTK